MSRSRAWASRLVALLLAVAMLGWACWLWQARKTVTNYLDAEARSDAPIPFCEWVSPAAPEIASVGLDVASSPVWTRTRRARLVFRTGSRQPWQIEVGVIAIASSSVSVSVDGNPARTVFPVHPQRNRTLRFQPAWNTPNGLHEIDITVTDPRPPGGKEQRWLGMAISGIRACDRLGDAPAH